MAAGAAGTQPTLASLKEEGSRAFAMKKYDEATAAWDKALAMDGIAAADVALLRNNKAACHMVAKRYKEAVSECSAALESQPEYLKALQRRAKAYESMGQYKQALADLQRANKLDGASDETRAAEKRVKDLASGKGAANGAARKTPATLGTPAGMGRQVNIPIKLSFGDDTRIFQVSPSVGYSELLEHSKKLFPNAGPFMLKFVDREGDLVTIGSRVDINRAIEEAVQSVDRKRLMQGGSLPPIRMQAVKVNSASEIPKAPEEDQKAMQQMLQQLQKYQQMQSKSAQQAQQAQQAPQLMVDEWILAFVDLLKDHCGINADAPAEIQEIGTDRLNAAFLSAITEDPKTDELLDQAEEKFRETAATGMTCQAQVHQARAQILMQKAAKAGKDAKSIAEAVEAHLAKAEAKLKEALDYCPTLLDAFLSRANIEQDRAKLAANYLVPPVAPREDLADVAARQAAEEEAAKAATLKAFERVTKEGVAAADKCMEAAYKHIQDGINALPEKEKNRELTPLKPMAEQDPSNPEDSTPLKAHLLISLGNSHYEHSILRAAADLDWKPLVTKAQELFREAGAAEADIRHALKGHPKAAEMEDIIGPEPEPEKPAAPASPAVEDAPKGLKALPRKKN